MFRPRFDFTGARPGSTGRLCLAHPKLACKRGSVPPGNAGKNGNPAESPAVYAVSLAMSPQLRRNEAATNVSEPSYFGRGLFAQRFQLQ
jgi:hypothetical protein